MCLSDLYNFEPKRHQKLAVLESRIRMRDALREADAISQFMPAAAVEVCPLPCAEVAAAGAYQEQAA